MNTFRIILSLSHPPKDTTKTMRMRRGWPYNRLATDRYGHLFPSEDHKRALDAIAGELIG